MVTETKKPRTAADDDVIDIVPIQRSIVEFAIVGTSPLLQNRVNQKAQRELLFPKKRDRLTLKHNPIDEFRASPYRISDGPTLLGFPCAAFKKAGMTAALDLPGTATKTRIGRLVRVVGDLTPIYGVPQLWMGIVRMADVKRTPDVRSLAIIPRWACRLTVSFVQPMLTAQAVANLLAAAGEIAGVGDGRIEKGKLDFGAFRLASPDDPELLAIIAEGGRDAQTRAMEHPTAYNADATELLDWFDRELATRQREGDTQAQKKTLKRAAARGSDLVAGQPS